MKHYATLTLFLLIFGSHSLHAQPGKLISQAHYSFNTGVIAGGDSFTVAYNAQLLPSMYLNFKLSDTGTWHITSRSAFYEYDANQNLLQFIQQLGNDQDGWTNNYRFSYAYNAANQETMQTSESWNGSAWEVDNSTVKSYDLQGNLISSESQVYRTIYTYNAEGFLETETAQVKSGGNWVNSAKEEYTYYAGTNRVELQTTYYWIVSNWEVYNRQNFQYDGNGNNTLIIGEAWNLNQWMFNYKQTMEYDGQNNLVFWTSAGWDGSGWIANARQFNTFNADNQFTSGRLESLNGSDWEMLTFGRLHYGVLSGSYGPGNFDFKVFPNPATSTVTVQCENLKMAQIVDRQGKLVSQLQLGQSAINKASVAHLSPGIYFLHVENAKGETGVKPFVIQR